MLQLHFFCIRFLVKASCVIFHGFHLGFLINKRSVLPSRYSGPACHMDCTIPVLSRGKPILLFFCLNVTCNIRYLLISTCTQVPVLKFSFCSKSSWHPKTIYTIKNNDVHVILLNQCIHQPNKRAVI